MHLYNFHQMPRICDDCRKPPGQGGWLTLKCEICRMHIFICPRKGCFQATPLEVMQAHHRRHRHEPFRGTSVTTVAEPVATCSNCGHDLSNSYYQCPLCEDVIYCCLVCDATKFQVLVDDHQRQVHYMAPMVMGYTRRYILDETGVTYTIIDNGRAIEAPAWVQWILVNIESDFWHTALRAAADTVNPIGAARAARAVAQTNGNVPRRRADGTSIVKDVAPRPATAKSPLVRYAYNGRPDWARSRIVPCEERFEAYDRALDEVVIDLPREPVDWYFHMRVGDSESPEWTARDEIDEELPDWKSFDPFFALEQQRRRARRQRKRRQLIVALLRYRVSSPQVSTPSNDQLLHWDASRRRREVAAQNGLCIGCCVRPIAEGLQRCQYCNERMLQFKRRLRSERVAAGQCYRCGDPAIPDLRICSDCSAALSEQRQQRRKARIAMNLCPACRTPVTDDFVHCARCRARFVAAQRLRS